MKDNLYSIGKVSRIMGISVPLLRHYCDVGLIKPEYVDPETGYRYFSFNQFHYLDRARYLLKCGFKLKEIKEVLVNNDIALLVSLMSEKRDEKRKEIQDARDVIDTLDWYNDYFSHREDEEDKTSYYVRRLPKRYLIAIKCDEDYTHQQFYERFNQMKNSDPYKSLKYYRQFTAIVDYHALMKKEIKRSYTGMVAQKPPGFKTENIIELPEGNYYCFKAPVLSARWNPYILTMLLKEHKVPKLTITSEYENSLQSYSECLHEVQMLFED
ncbi:helix-turn-helix domain-containing protein [Eubacteriales bacterium OttesenSCG-928-K08]|nr:helix-turn-helix domain-containing protein [Eubacteriales bacterium OttesenSCG-928-K08]